MWATTWLILGAAMIHLCRMEMYAKYTERLASEVETSLESIRAKSSEDVAQTVVTTAETVMVDNGLGDANYGV